MESCTAEVYGISTAQLHTALKTSDALVADVTAMHARIGLS